MNCFKCGATPPELLIYNNGQTKGFICDNCCTCEACGTKVNLQIVLSRRDIYYYACPDHDPTYPCWILEKILRRQKYIDMVSSGGIPFSSKYLDDLSNEINNDREKFNCCE